MEEFLAQFQRGAAHPRGLHHRRLRRAARAAPGKRSRSEPPPPTRVPRDNVFVQVGASPRAECEQAAYPLRTDSTSLSGQRCLELTVHRSVEGQWQPPAAGTSVVGYLFISL